WAPGAYTYWPNNGFVGTDSFTYTIHDSYGGEATGTVYINVVNVPPFAFPDLYYWKWGMHMTPAENDIDAEGDGVTFESIQTSTQFGVLNAWSAGTYTYMPTPGSGPLADYFLYSIKDTYGAGAIGVSIILVTDDSWNLGRLRCKGVGEPVDV